MVDWYYPSQGRGNIHACRWNPEVPVKGIIQIVHGIAEYAQRYDHLANYLSTLGYLVVAEDHMGHGSSCGEDCTQGYFDGGWFAAVADCHHLMEQIQKEHPDVPYILFGHSMGSFLVRTMLIQYPDMKLSGAIICGTGWMSGFILKAGFAVSKAVCRLQDERKPNKLLHSLMFGSYNKRVAEKRTAFDWLSTDPAVVDAYIEDPLCGFPETAGLARDMLSGILFIQNSDHLRQMNTDLPVFFIAGGEDPVGEYGAGVRKAVAQFKRIGMKQVSCKIYAGYRHEIHNESDKEVVYAGIADWIEKVLC